MYKIRCFGIAKDITDQAIMECDGNFKNVAGLRSWLNTTYPRFGTLSKYMIAINEEYALEDQLLNAGDVIAIIPPVSGG